MGQAEIHDDGSSTLYVSIASPPTPASSPPPTATFAGAPLPVCTTLSTAQPTLRMQYLANLLPTLTPTELLYVSTESAARLKRDFLLSLPPEISLQILDFIDDPRTLARAMQVSKHWATLFQDENIWLRMCTSWNFLDDGAPSSSFQRYFGRCYSTLQNWRRGPSSALIKAHAIFTYPRDEGSEVESGTPGVITSCALDDEWIVVGLANNRLHVFSCQTGVLARTLVGHTGGVWSVDPNMRSDPCSAAEGWGQPNALVVSGGCDKKLRVWDVKTGYCLHVLAGHRSTIRCIKVLHRQSIVITGSRDATLRVWDIQHGKLLHVLEGHGNSVRCIDVAGDRVVSGSYDTTLRIWDVKTGKCLHILAGHLQQIYCVVFDGVHVVSGGLDTTVRVWDAETGHCIALLTGHSALVCQLQILQATTTKEPLLATGGSDGRVITYSLNTFHPVYRLAAHDSSVTSLQLDRYFLVTGGNDGHVRLFDSQTGAPVRELSSPSDCVWRVCFLPTTRNVCVVMCRRHGRSVVEVWRFGK
ncbi:WD40 repeat-like protein [Fistulina hepatica ATCC 64428]|uniref:WD40 repeat-like protein n=1 Tax=Fistulina hepatica ATCC 64428 TaxID=1128425 RepID=A0A0D7AKS3_9AGAR|nr:WD40 repeat-like protein [Fistulina hepatica ATCC 64428]